MRKEITKEQREIIRAIESLWDQNPDLRFYQVLSLVESYIQPKGKQESKQDHFYLEDNKLLEAVKMAMRGKQGCRLPPDSPKHPNLH